jgi:hypothetical protein
VQVHKHACIRLLASLVVACCIALSVCLYLQPCLAAPGETVATHGMESPEAAVPVDEPLPAAATGCFSTVATDR